MKNFEYSERRNSLLPFDRSVKRRIHFNTRIQEIRKKLMKDRLKKTLDE